MKEYVASGAAEGESVFVRRMGSAVGAERRRVVDGEEWS